VQAPGLRVFGGYDKPAKADKRPDHGGNFESDTGDSTVRLQVIDNEGSREVRIFGSMTGNSASGGTDIGTFYLDVTYSVASNANDAVRSGRRFAKARASP